MKCEYCNKVKQIEDFPKRRRKDSPIQGTVCRPCSKKIIKRNYYDRNTELCRQRAKDQRESDPEAYKAYLRKYYEENKDTLREKSREYNSRFRKETNARLREYRKNNPLKAKARSIVSGAIRSGKLIRPSTCTSCEREVFAEAHHHDYEKPLDVIWLCKSCHWKEHSKH